jgi:hypothetical protein
MGTPSATMRCPARQQEAAMDIPRDDVPYSRRETRKLVFIVGGMSILGILALIAFVLFSGFPGSPQSSADKSEAPPEDVRKATP